ncbi:MAG: Fe-S cluster assembly ATPase SufC [Candidatus Hinthialibacter antarcticus]|nr:Fe-S cluster assembly ATPase SufC [Candidatus Hinthialibacter antarcticus]
MLLDIKNLHASIDGKEILKGVNLTVNPGEVHAIMGPNGSGKSTLSQVLAGNDAYEVTAGEIMFNGKDLLELEPDERACEGIFMAFQYPVEIPGVQNNYFLKTAYNAIRKYRGQEEVDAVTFIKLLKEKAKLVDLDDKLMKRNVNEGFSGGEKKRNEIFQMAVLDPLLAVLDETDSGLDVDALRTVAGGVDKLRDDKRGIICITHYQRILNYLEPDIVHILANGKIVRTGGSDLAHEVEAKGYAWLDEGAA